MFKPFSLCYTKVQPLVAKGNLPQIVCPEVIMEMVWGKVERLSEIQVPTFTVTAINNPRALPWLRYVV